MPRSSRTEQMSFEQLDGYPKPASLPPLDTLENYVREYSEMAHVPQAAARFLFGVSGFTRTLHRLRQDAAYYERVLRDVPARMMVSNAIMFSATAVLADEQPAPDPIDRAARLLAASRSFYADLIGAKFPLDTFHGEPMEMGQYRNLFSTCNYPSGACMGIYKSVEDSYAVVAAGGNFYKLALPPIGTPADVPSLRAALEALAADARGRPQTVSPGPFSAAAPAQRAAGFTLLRLDPRNRESLEALANAFLVLCLDLDDRPADEEQACRLAQCRNRENRWYLASTQIVVFGNGKASIVFSYICGIDGNVMTRFSSEVRRSSLLLKESASRRKKSPRPDVQRLPFSVPAGLARWADSSCRYMLTDERVLFRIRDWGGRELIRRGLRLDSVFNIAMMMAEEQLLGRPPVHVELLTMAKYRYRGLGDATPWSPAVSRLVDPACDADLGRAAVETLREALEAHHQAIRAGRERFNLSDLMSLHLALAAPWRMPASMILLMKYMSSIDVIVSFPHPSEDVAVVGRIGIRLLTRLFSLHYETSPESVSVAFMPAQSRPVPAQKAWAALEEALRKIVRIGRLLPEIEGAPLIRIEKGPQPSAVKHPDGTPVS
ncbi:MAG: choline/carnitine O-acyltransferase [Anaerolineales bacterium]|nr:choline/carnitine O-acyltransferase [Anaerolineales bacterium]